MRKPRRRKPQVVRDALTPDEQRDRLEQMLLTRAHEIEEKRAVRADLAAAVVAEKLKKLADKTAAATAAAAAAKKGVSK